MVVWIKPEAAKMPKAQRAEVLDVKKEEHGGLLVEVMLLGDQEYYKVHPTDICGVEIAPGVDLMFEVDSYKWLRGFVKR